MSFWCLCCPGRRAGDDRSSCCRSTHEAVSFVRSPIGCLEQFTHQMNLARFQRIVRLAKERKKSRVG